MAKRKSPDSESEEYSENEEASTSSVGEKSGKETKASKKQKQKKMPPSKKVKEAGEATPIQTEPAQDTPSGEIKIHTTEEGDKYIDLGKKRRAVVRSFKGMSLLDIREFYGADGQEKPGKKGISLTLDQWKSLKEGMSVIDELFAAQKKK